MNTKEQLINKIIKERNYTSYLEIGVQNGYCFNQIECEVKLAVDPVWTDRITEFEMMDSDTFFKANSNTFDIVFIDGLHHSDQVLADLVNSASILNPGGTILLHDMLPTSEVTQRVPRASKEWYGDCWKVGHILSFANYDIEFKIHEFDCGIAEIQLGRDGLDELLCDFTDNLERLKDLDYNRDFDDYKMSF